MGPRSTFASQLDHFAQSVDIVDKDIFDNVRELVVSYTQSFGATYFELVKKTIFGRDQLSLQRFWSSDDGVRQLAWPVRSENAAYTNMISQSFCTRMPMWIIGQKNETLDKPPYIDLWSKTTDHPRYDAPSSSDIKTLIILPLCTIYDFGAFYVEIPKRLTLTDVSRQEFKLLADALESLYCMFEMDRFRSEKKQKTLTYLRDQLRNSQFPRTAVPHLFKAYPSNSDQAVRRSIDKVLVEFSGTGKIDVTDWNRIYRSGSIPAQISKEIAESSLGVCYFSEPAAETGETRYVDNPNVLFEAGMLHARTSANAGDVTGQPTGWIPIREKDSPKVPFDFAAERIVYVPRDDQGALITDAFEEDLRSHLEALLNTTLA